jgi:Arylsulfotransferase (ASST)
LRIGGPGRPALLLVLVAIAVAVSLSAPARSLASTGDGRLTISPAPNTPDASPQTQISILGVARSRIRSVSVTGQSSGAHTGRLLSYSRHRGASFVPDQPLSRGESVAVVVRVRGRKPIRFGFTVATPGAKLGPLTLTSTQPDKLDHFATEPGLIPPKVTVSQSSKGARGNGDVLLTPLPSPVVHPESNNTVTIKPVGPGGPMIVDGAGNLVWFRQLAPPEVAANLRLQTFKGRKVLTWWEGTVTPAAFGVGGGVIANRSYRIIKVVHAGNGYPMDLHEFQLTRDGDALFTIYSPILVHLPGTPDGTVSPLLDAIVQEVDIHTGLVVWEWHSYGHVPLETSQATPQNSASFDAFHINAVQPLARDRVLISARDTSAVYDVDRASGRILWTLGGKGSNFRLGPGAQFHFQHDAHMLSNGRLSMFDDGAGPPQLNPFSRGIILQLDHRRRKATLVRQFARSSDTSAQSEGSMQRLPGGNVFVGFGSEPFFSEFSSRGRLLLDGSLPADDGTYRTYRFPWTATPKTAPAVAAQRSGPSSVSVFASWNGATEVAKWQVLAGPSAGSLTRVATVRKRSFETRVDLSSSATLFAVRALDSRGRTIGHSSVIPAS